MIEYAIKKIRIKDSEKELKKTMKEVLLTSRLMHQNIIWYYNAWIEDVPKSLAFPDYEEEEEEEEIEDDSDDEFWDISSKEKLSFSARKASEAIRQLDEDDFLYWDEDLYKEQQTDLNWDPFAQEDEDYISSHEVKSVKSDDPKEVYDRSHSIRQMSDKLTIKILYLQMEYCSENSLKILIDSRKGLNMSDNPEKYDEICQ